MAEKPIGADATGYEVLTKAVEELLNEYPGLNGRVVVFEELEETSGITFSADNGALVMSESRNILDRVTQTCQYPFFVVYRTAATRAPQKLNVQSFLDAMGKWLCKEKAVVNGTEVQLDTYPELTGGRKITRLTRNNSYAVEPMENGAQDWLLPVVVEYTNEFDD